MVNQSSALSFKGKAALVFGGTAGIGRSVALAFASAGANVFISGLGAADGREVEAEARNKGVDAAFMEADVTRASEVQAVVSRAAERFGRIHAAVNNAGIEGRFGPVHELQEADFDRIIGVNLRGCYLGLKSVGKSITKGGAVVVTASTAGLMGWSTNVPYTASKHGILGLVRSTAEAFAARGVRINAICPGMVNTPMFLPDGNEDQLLPPDDLAMPAFRGVAMAQHIAELVLFLASNRAAFMTGGIHVIDGGLTSTFPG